MAVWVVEVIHKLIFFVHKKHRQKAKSTWKIHGILS